MSRARLFIFGAVIAATAVLAVLGYVSLRQWQASAELLFREQARDMATMAAEKVEMAILKTEEECLSSLQIILMEPAFRAESLEAWSRKNPLFDRVSLIDRQGRVLYPSGGQMPTPACCSRSRRGSGSAAVGATSSWATRSCWPPSCRGPPALPSSPPSDAARRP